MADEPNGEPVIKRGTAIKRCTCYSPFQDGEHGVGLRVHNKMRDATRSRCTVCGKVKS